MKNRVKLFKKSGKTAFTLAEVLITLGVIGVVSAITMPTLIKNYKNHVVETRLKKFYSVFNQAIQRSIADNGEMQNWEYFSDTGNNMSAQDIKNKFNQYLKPYINIVSEKDMTSENGERSFVVYYLSDGSAFAYNSNQIRDIIFIPKNPDKVIKNYDDSTTNGSSHFSFVFMPVSQSPSWIYHYNKGLEPNMYAWDGTKESLYSGQDMSCIGDTANYCTALIQNNGWKIPKDYPRKINY